MMIEDVLDEFFDISIYTGGVERAQRSLKNSVANTGYTEGRSSLYRGIYEITKNKSDFIAAVQVKIEKFEKEASVVKTETNEKIKQILQTTLNYIEDNTVSYYNLIEYFSAVLILQEFRIHGYTKTFMYPKMRLINIYDIVRCYLLALTIETCLDAGYDTEKFDLWQNKEAITFANLSIKLSIFDGHLLTADYAAYRLEYTQLVKFVYYGSGYRIHYVLEFNGKNYYDPPEDIIKQAVDELSEYKGDDFDDFCLDCNNDDSIQVVAWKDEMGIMLNLIKENFNVSYFLPEITDKEYVKKIVIDFVYGKIPDLTGWENIGISEIGVIDEADKDEQQPEINADKLQNNARIITMNGKEIREKFANALYISDKTIINVTNILVSAYLDGVGFDWEQKYNVCCDDKTCKIYDSDDIVGLEYQFRYVPVEKSIRVLDEKIITDAECPECGNKMRYRQKTSEYPYGYFKCEKCNNKVKVRLVGRLVFDLACRQVIFKNSDN